jgi:glycine dehydrogenase subunit 1
VRKAHYAAEKLCAIPGVALKFKTPFVKEFALSVRGNIPALLARLRKEGYHAGLSLGRWYPNMMDGLTVAVTEKRTKAEIDGLAAALGANL